MNVLITGASKGIGREISKCFAKEGAIELYLLSRSESALKTLCEECRAINRNSNIHILKFNLNELNQNPVPVLKDCKQLDILINNAGLLINKRFEDMEVFEIQEQMYTNFMAPALLIKQYMGIMGGTSPGHVVNIGSMGGFQGSAKFPGLSVYSATKAALASLTECLASEITDRNVFFNCLALGAVQTEMLQKAFPEFKAPVNAEQMAQFIVHFALNGYKYFNGKVLPVSLSTP